jgi:death-on-curing protein
LLKNMSALLRIWVQFLTLEEVISIHHYLVRRFGGSQGIRDRGILNSAVHVPQATYGGGGLFV